MAPTGSALTHDDGSLTARFGIVASSIAGRSLHVAQCDGGAWTDGRTVFVDVAEDIQRQVITQAALIHAGSLAPRVVRQLIGRPSLNRRYLSVEGCRAIAALSEILPAHTMPGVCTVGFVLPDSAEAALKLAQSRVPVSESPPWFGVIKPRRLLGQGDVLAGSLPGESADPVRLPYTKATDEEDDENADLAQTSATSAPTRSGLLGDNRLTRALRRQLDMSGSAGELGARDAMGATKSTRMRRTAALLLGVPDGRADDQFLGLHAQLMRYPEWDERRQSYRADWCSVVEVTPSAEELSPLPRPARHDPLRRVLAPLGLGPQRRRRQRAGYDIDLDALVEARVDATSGHTVAEALYIDNVRSRRDLGVLVLLDASGSSTELDPTGDALYQRQRDAAAALIDTLAIQDDRVAGYAFASSGREVVFTRVKGFDEGFGELQMARLGGVRPDGFTRMGAAVRHATQILDDDRGARHRLLVLISDGFPYDSAYEGQYAEMDTRKALSEARARGVGCVCVNLSSRTDADALDRVFGAASHATAHDIDMIAPHVRSMFLLAIHTASRDNRKRYCAPLVTSTKART